MRVTTFLRMTYRLFEDKSHTGKYLLYRPSYPKNLIDYVISYTKAKCPSLERGVDVGCGSGQGTALFAKYFTEMIGIDISKEQINRANEYYSTSLPNTNFVVSGAESIPASMSSVDFIMCAQSFHWLNEKQFFEEIDRVLKPGGTLAVFGYYLPIYENEDINEVMNEIYEGILGKYWSPRRRMIENYYKDVTLPLNDVQREVFTEGDSGSIADLANLISTWSAYETYRKENPDHLSLEEIVQRLLEGTESDQNAKDSIVQFRREYFLVMGRKG